MVKECLITEEIKLRLWNGKNGYYRGHDQSLSNDLLLDF